MIFLREELFEALKAWKKYFGMAMNGRCGLWAEIPLKMLPLTIYLWVWTLKLWLFPFFLTFSLNKFSFFLPILSLELLNYSPGAKRDYLPLGFPLAAISALQISASFLSKLPSNLVPPGHCCLCSNPLFAIDFCNGWCEVSQIYDLLLCLGVCLREISSEYCFS